MKSSIIRVAVLVVGVVGTSLTMERQTVNRQNVPTQVPPNNTQVLPNQKIAYQAAKLVGTGNITATKRQERQQNGPPAAMRRLDFNNVQ